MSFSRLQLEQDTTLLKIPHTLVTEHGEIKQELSWKLVCLIAFIVLKGAIQTNGKFINGVRKL